MLGDTGLLSVYRIIHHWNEPLNQVRFLIFDATKHLNLWLKK